MRTIKSSAAIALIGLLAAQASATTLAPMPAGKVNFKLTALTQLADAVTLKTNKTSTGTNIVKTVTSKTQRTVLFNKDILSLLVNSFTNLPTTVVTNGHLATDGKGNFFVVTATTTNDVSSVLSYSADQAVFSGSETTKTKTPPGTLVSETESLTSTQWNDLIYNDSSLTTRNGKHSNFDVSGILTTQWGDKNTAPKFSQSLNFNCNGDGTIDDKFVVITSGNVNATLTAVLDDVP